MKRLFQLPMTQWEQTITVEQQRQAICALEAGQVVFFPQLAFNLLDKELVFLSPSCADNSRLKNISYDAGSHRLKGSVCKGEAYQQLQGMMQRYATGVNHFMTQLFPQYQGKLRQARTSYRPIEALGRAQSTRKNDARLHVDAFPSAPTQGDRILRVFTNVNPDAQPRVWRLGEAFFSVVNRFQPAFTRPIPGKAKLLHRLKLTKQYRSAYDHYMLQLHDAMKADDHYQVRADQARIEFPSGSTWVVFTDQVSHAAMSGQYLFEQTFYLPASAMRDPERAPIRVLERAFSRRLVAA